MASVVPVLAVAATLVSSPGITDLAFGQGQGGELRADAVADYRIALEAGEAYLIELEQAGLDFIVTLQDPHGEQVSYNAPLLRVEPDRVLVEPTRQGNHTIRLSSDEFTGGLGEYVLTVTRLETNGPRATLRRNALRHETRAAALYFAGAKGDWDEVISEFRAAAGIWDELGEARASARASMALAHVLHQELTDWKSSSAEAARAAELYRAAGNDSLYASALHLKASSLIEEATQLSAGTVETANVRESAQLFSEAFEIAIEALSIKSLHADNYERARIINHIGISSYYQGDLDTARSHFVDAAAIFREAEEWSEELKSTMNLSVIEMTQGHLGAAIDSFSRLIELATPERSPDLRGYALDNMSIAYRALGDIDNALASSLEALQLHEARGELKAQGQSLGDIGIAYYLAGDLERAREHLESALEIRRQARDGRGQAAALRVLGNIYREQQDLERAIAAHREASSIGGSASVRALAQVLLGRDLAAAGRMEESLSELDAAVVEAHNASRPLIDVAARIERGAVFRLSGQVEKSETDLREALDAGQELGLPRLEARAAFELALLSRDAGRLADAEGYALRAIEIVERQRGRISNPDMRAAFLGSRQDYYHFYIDVMGGRHAETGEPHYVHTALEMSERARARAFIDLLMDSSVSTTAGWPQELRDQESKLHRELAELRFRHDRLLAAGKVGNELKDVLRRLRRVETELDLLETEIQRDGPSYAGLQSPVTLDVSGIQGGLDADSVLIQYALGDPRSYVFIVTDSSVDMIELAPGPEIAGLAHTTHESLKTLDPGQPAADRALPLRELAARVLWPIQHLLDRRRLVVVPDGALHYVPFAVLPLQDPGNQEVRLLARHEIVNLPSMSALVAQSRQLDGRRPSDSVIAVFADPVFDRGDPRMPPTADADKPGQVPWASVPGAWDTSPLHRLPSTGKEAEVIAALVPELRRLVMTGLEANREAILGRSLLGYRVIHLATHGLIDSRYPALSALAFSAFDAEGQATDGRVRLRDIYNLKLNADLVVLSACDTALGRELRGEGVIGLTRGFQYAGSRTVIASLWQVPDQATAKLMEHMYSAFLGDGKTATAALREAQLTIASTRRWRDPYYWAPLVAYGEWH